MSDEGCLAPLRAAIRHLSDRILGEVDVVRQGEALNLISDSELAARLSPNHLPGRTFVSTVAEGAVNAVKPA
jgi:hypothetical protein